MSKLSTLRHVHVPGLSHLCTDGGARYCPISNGPRSVLSCGIEGDARVWNGFGEEWAQPRNISLGEAATALSLNGSKIYAGVHPENSPHRSKLQVFDFASGVALDVLCCLSLPVTCIDVEGETRTVLIGSADFSVKGFRIGEGNVESLRFGDHVAPVQSVVTSFESEFFATSSCDATVKIWKLDEPASEPIKSLVLLPKYNEIRCDRGLSHLSWHSNGELVIPCKGEILTVEARSNWKILNKFIVPQLNEAVFSVTCLSPCGKYLAAGTLEGDLVAWEWVSRRAILIAKHPTGKPVTGVVWNPEKPDEIVFIDCQGQMGTVVDVLEEVGLGGIHSNTTNQPIEDDEEYSKSSDIGAIKKQYGFFEEGEANDFSHISRKVSREDKPRVLSPVLYSPDPPASSWKPEAPPSTFMSASTPMAHPKRYLKWNNVGYIAQHLDEDGNNIEVAFHDVTIHASIHVDNSLSNYSIGDISTQAVALASQSNSNQDTSRIFVQNLECWDIKSREWSVNLPNGEICTAMSLGTDYLCIISDQNIARVVTLTGMQLHIWALQSQAITLASYSNQLTIALLGDMNWQGQSSLRVHMFCVKTEGTVTRPVSRCLTLPICLSVDSTLTWMGFSSQGSLCTCDSVGVIRMLNKDFHHTWLPICNWRDERKGVSDTYWVVGVRESPTPQIRVIFCKGSKYPLLYPKPTVTTLQWNIPLLDKGTDRSELEQNLILTKMHAAHLNQAGDIAAAQSLIASETKLTLRLFALAVRKEKDNRAYDVAKLMPDAHGVQLLIQYASQSRRMGLAEKLSTLARLKRMQEDEDVDSEPVENDIQPVIQERNQPVQSRPVKSPPKLVMVNKQRTNQNEDSIGESSTRPEYSSDSDDKEDIYNNHLHTDTISLPTSQTKRNPFKRNVACDSESAPASSVFDEMVRVPKRKAATSHSAQANKPKNQKQSTLNFEQTPKENLSSTTNTKRTAFSMWLDASKSHLSQEYEGEAQQFNKFAVEQFRKLEPHERKKWSDVARQDSRDMLDSSGIIDRSNASINVSQLSFGSIADKLSQFNYES